MWWLWQQGAWLCTFWEEMTSGVGKFLERLSQEGYLLRVDDMDPKFWSGFLVSGCRHHTGSPEKDSMGCLTNLWILAGPRWLLCGNKWGPAAPQGQSETPSKRDFLLVSSASSLTGLFPTKTYEAVMFLLFGKQIICCTETLGRLSQVTQLGCGGASAWIQKVCVPDSSV